MAAPNGSPAYAPLEARYVESDSRLPAALNHPSTILDDTAGSGSRRRRVDHSPDLGDLRGGEPADFRVPLNGSDIFRQVDAEGLVFRNIGLDPLHIGAELGKCRIRGFCRFPELVTLKCADLWNIAFDHVFLQHGKAPFVVFCRLADRIAGRPQAGLSALCLRYFCGQGGWRCRYFC